MESSAVSGSTSKAQDVTAEVFGRILYLFIDLFIPSESHVTWAEAVDAF